MTAAQDDLYAVLAEAVEARRQSAVGHLALAQASLSLMLETLRWQPAGESPEGAQAQHDHHYAVAVRDLSAMKNIQIAMAPPAPALEPVDRIAKLDKLGGSIVETAALAREALTDIDAVVKGLGAGDDRTLSAMLDDLEGRCAAMRAAVSEAAQVARCEGSA